MSAEQKKSKKFVRMARPKYKEQYSSEESASFQPWRVDLKVELDEFDSTPVTYTVFCRCKDVNDAQIIAFNVFNYLTHILPLSLGILPEGDPEYPKICTVPEIKNYKELMTDETTSVAYPLSEDQWYDALKEAHSYNNSFYVGMKENPSIFRFARPGWDDRGGILKGSGRSIIMPDKGLDIRTLPSSTKKTIQKINENIKRNNK